MTGSRTPSAGAIRHTGPGAPDGRIAADRRADAAFDRFVSNYVLDLLSPADIAAVLVDAHRVLRPDGLLCLVSLTHGTTRLSRAVTATLDPHPPLRPSLVGGCRPIELRNYLRDPAGRSSTAAS